MARFCPNCGTELEEGASFCTECGAPAQQPTPPVQQPTQPVQPPVEQPQQFAPQQPVPPVQPQYVQQPVQQPAYQPAPPQPQSVPQSGGKKTGKLWIPIAALLVVAIGVVCFLGFREGGFFRGSPATAPQRSNTQMLLEYAKKLEAAGNYEAAAAVYEHLPAAAQQDAQQKTRELMNDPSLRMIGSLGEEDLSALGGGASAQQSGFADVSADDWYYESVVWAAQSGVISGDTVHPNDVCTRAQALTFLWRAAGCPAPAMTASPFADVTPEDYFFQPVLWALEHGLIADSGDGLFFPNDPATRAQAVTFLYRAAGEPAQSGVPAFVDVSAESWYAPAVLWAQGRGLVSPGSAFDPDGACVRAVFLTFLYRNYR